MTYSEPVAPAAIETATPRLSLSTALLIGAFCIIAVYCTSWSLHTIDASSGSIATNLSLSEYRDMLAGVAGFPYQWRLLGSYLVYAGERLTGFPPHHDRSGGENAAAVCVDVPAVSLQPLVHERRRRLRGHRVLSPADGGGLHRRAVPDLLHQRLRHGDVLVRRRVPDPLRTLHGSRGFDVRRRVGEGNHDARADSAGVRVADVATGARRVRGVSDRLGHSDGGAAHSVSRPASRSGPGGTWCSRTFRFCSGRCTSSA